jgi:hypothetical protein
MDLFEQAILVRPGEEKVLSCSSGQGGKTLVLKIPLREQYYLVESRQVVGWMSPTGFGDSDPESQSCTQEGVGQSGSWMQTNSPNYLEPLFGWIKEIQIFVDKENNVLFRCGLREKIRGYWLRPPKKVNWPFRRLS